MPKFSIIIVNYNSGNFLAELVDSFKALKLPVSEFEFIVVDNNSRDDSLSRASWGDLDKRFILNKDNYGFARAANQGIKISRGEFIVWLTPDTKVLNDIFSIMEKAMLRDSRIGICAPKVYYPDGGIQLTCFSFPSLARQFLLMAGITDFVVKNDSIVNFLKRLSGFLPVSARLFLGNFSQAVNPIEVPWLSGVGAMFRRSLFDEVGLLDDNFFAYAEDEDFCLRARNKGYRIYWIPEAKIIHYRGWNRYVKKSQELMAIYFISLKYFYSKHYKGFKKAGFIFLNNLDRVLNNILTPKTYSVMYCLICGREGRADLIEFHNSYRIYECALCKGQFVSPPDIPPEQYRQWYEGTADDGVSYSSYISLAPDKILGGYRNSAPAKLTLRMMKGIRGRKKLLDLGCSQGAFCRITQDLGFDVYGVEPSEEAVEYAVKKLKLNNITAGCLEDIPEDWRDFDVITALGVMEHLCNPRQTTMQIFKLLKPGGYFLLSLPNNNSLDTMLGRRNKVDFPPHHLTRWRKSTLDYFLRDAGFTNVRIKNTLIDRLLVGMLIKQDLIYQRSELLGLWTSAKAEGGTSGARRLRYIWPLAQLLGDVSALILNLFFFNHGATLVALAQKPKEK